jgi:GT2 family glycosyltransferase
MDTLDVVAAVVAYNNPIELKCILNSIKEQSYKVKRIVIVDNSNEEAAQKNYSLLHLFDDKENFILYKRLPKNVGSAGGYALAMKLGHELGCDFVWLNDQDGIPNENCLEALIDGYYEKKEPAVYTPKIIDIKDGYELRSFRAMINRFGNMVPRDDNDENIQIIDLSGTTGILVHDDIIRRIGVYNDRAFFVGGEDLEYSLRTKKYGYRTYLIKSALYRHPDLFKKYNEKNRLITRIPISYRMRPRNLGIVRDDNERNRKMCIGAAYINETYCRAPYKYVNVVYSCIRVLLTSIIWGHSKMRLTYKCYLIGKNMAKKDKKL